MLSYLTLLIFPNKITNKIPNNMLKRFCNNIVMISITLLFIIPNLTTPIFAADNDNNKNNTILSEKQKISEPKTLLPEQHRLAPEKEIKLHVTSDSMLVEKESLLITFSGNVVATQEDSLIKSDKLSVLLFTDKEKQANQSNLRHDIKSLTASGNVKFSSGNRTASADQAVYTSADQKIILTGDSPRVMTGESYVTGKKITLFQDSGRVIVEGGKEQRVEALFNSKEDFKQNYVPKVLTQ